MRGTLAEVLGSQSSQEGQLAIGSEQRRDERRHRVEAAFPRGHVDAALDLLHLADMAWHDCYGPRELEIPPRVLDDILLLAHGDLARLVRVAREAVIDFRNIRLAADRTRLDDGNPYG